MTLRPSCVLAATGVTSTSVSGVQDRSRNRPSASRTTTIASSAPRLGRPASRTAAPAVVPAATRIGATRTELAGALIGDSPNFRSYGRSALVGTERDHAIGAGGHAPRPIGLFSHSCWTPKRSADQPTAPSNHRVVITIA